MFALFNGHCCSVCDEKLQKDRCETASTIMKQAAEIVLFEGKKSTFCGKAVQCAPRKPSPMVKKQKVA